MPTCIVTYKYVFPLLFTGAGSLIHMKPPSSFNHCKEFDPGLLSTIRHHLKKNKYYNIEGLLPAFLHLDKVSLRTA